MRPSLVMVALLVLPQTAMAQPPQPPPGPPHTQLLRNAEDIGVDEARLTAIEAVFERHAPEVEAHQAALHELRDTVMSEVRALLTEQEWADLEAMRPADPPGPPQPPGGGPR